MSMITPMGKRPAWIPAEIKMVKEASQGSKVKTVSETGAESALYEAAKKVVEAMGVCPECQGKGPACTCVKDPKDSVQSAQPAEDVAIIELDLPGQIDGQTDDVMVEPVAEEKAEAQSVDSAIDKVEEAVQTIEQAINELKDVNEEEQEELAELDVDVIEDGNEVGEVEIEIDEDGDVEKGDGEDDDKDNEDDEDDEDDKDDELVKESEDKEDKEACASAKSAKKVSATSEEFYRFGMLSKTNKQKVKDYWKNILGYPADYVEKMIQDYEK